MREKKQEKTTGMLLFYTFWVFAALMVDTLLVLVCVYILINCGLWDKIIGSRIELWDLMALQAVVSLPIGALMAFAMSKGIIEPLQRLVDSMYALANGRFETRMESKGLIWRYPAFSEAVASFNTLAEELENTELLRSDFINNFSHEFKTPIVSIAGFAKLLRRGNLSSEQQTEYLMVIEEESMRLSRLATNVLNLSKVENMTILTDVTCFNLSEQLRSAILLLENKWEPKQIELVLQFREYEIYANEELLKQVWINLLDNAIKFSPVYGTVEVYVEAAADDITVGICNTGSEIPSEEMSRIFNKFYQGDQAHATEGNGVGLAVVKAVTELHGGTVTVESKDNVTCFCVRLPRNCK